MVPSTFTVHNSAALCRPHCRAAFSLVEVTLAIGIVAFAFTGVLGILPVGMSTFRKAIDTTVGGQIAQHVINDAQQTDFDQLITDSNGSTITGTNATGRKTVRYFDEQGVEIIPVASPSLSAAETQRIIYWVNTRVLAQTTTPQTGAAPVASVNLATITVEIAGNPANQTPALSPGQSDDATTPLRNLWSGAASAPRVPLQTRCALVSRNK